MHIKINNTFIDNAVDPDIVIPMYYLLEYSSNCSITSGILKDCHRDEVKDDINENNVVSHYMINNDKITPSKSFEYKTKKEGAHHMIMKH